MEVIRLLDRALLGKRLSNEQGIFLFMHAPTSLLMHTAHQLRLSKHPEPIVTWQTDRNVNITNACVSFCSFCNFCRKPNSNEAYTTGIEEYRNKINELFAAGGDQLLLQGGLHPDLGLVYYSSLFSQLKTEFPSLKLHALGPPEIAFLAKKEKMSIDGVLDTLIAHGLNSLPGAGAEILSDRVRKIISPAKCTSNEWLYVMERAHIKGLLTSSTMMFGHVETIEERFEHLDKLRLLQDKVNGHGPGFLSFIPWTIQSEGIRLTKNYKINPISASEYVRMLALSRIMLDNIPNIQASWLTVGVNTAQVCLHAGANDMGSVMIEENVVSAAGAKHRLDRTSMINAISSAGFVPRQRNQAYNFVD